MEILCNIFLWFFYSTLAASTVALLVIAIQKLFHHHLSARLQHALWLIVLVRLLLPDFPNSDASIFNVALHIKNAVSIIHLDAYHSSNEISRNSEEKKIQQNDLNMATEINHAIPETLSVQEVEQPLLSFSDIYPLVLPIISTIWFGGTVTLITYLCSYLLRMRKRAKRLTLVTDPRILSVLEECQRKFDIKKPVPLYTGNYAKSPCISGLIHPWIFVPELVVKELTSTQLLHIFSHELAHLKRKDTWWNVLSCFVLAIHWMNPIVWICIKRMKADREIACDAYVLDVLGENEATPYGLTMIDFLKLFSSKSAHPQLLYFGGTNNQNEMVRRITMIKTFKKGSYKFSALAIVCMIGLGSATLTNAATSAPASSSDSVAQTGGDQILFDSSHRIYNNLEKAVKVSPTAFKVPDLPELKLKAVRLDLTGKKFSGVAMDFRRDARTYFDVVVIPSGVEHNDIIWTQRQSSEIKKETLNLNGLKILKLTDNEDSFSRSVYFWEEQGLQYKLDGPASNPQQEMLNVISSMKLPDKNMLKRYKTDDLFKTPVYDTEDLRYAQESLGFAPKMPLQLLGTFKAIGADVYYRDTDHTSKGFIVRYERTNKQAKFKESFYVDQDKDTSMFQEIKKNGSATFERIDGQKFNVKATRLQLEGKEVFKTEKYKIDEALSSPDEHDNISYFWVENDLCYQVMFIEDIPQQQDIVAELIKAQSVDEKN
ncbi:M56 family metallopeptidase [Brevibacillus brevis]|uniref:M56 family metallopeptidase n=1 Tax=Brevibacillus brevis TaxID=1393 RepID=UPI001EDAB30E|nr:M56 family metallopeptidase [Brevibacillus brevis]UKL01112.1 M56 family metallopeptidase [Brevibacillus brevis]